MEEVPGNYEEEEKEQSDNKKKKKKNKKSGKALKIEDENNSHNICSSLSPMVSTVGIKFDLTNDFMSKEFVEFLKDEGIDVNLMDSEKVKDLKKKYGEVEICRSKFEYKHAILSIKLQHLKFQQYQRALQKLS